MPFGSPSVAALVDTLPRTDQPALVDAGGTISYAALTDMICRAVTVMSEAGVRPGSKVAATAPNSSMFIIAFLAAQRLGAIWAGINPVLAAPEKAELLHMIAPSHVMAPADKLAMLMDDVPASVQWSASIEGFAGQVLAAAPAQLPPLPDPLAPAAIGFTSGSTGVPKSVVHSQHNMMAFVNGCVHGRLDPQWAHGLRRTLPIFLTILNGMIYGPVVALASGGTFVSMDRMDAPGIGQWIERERIEVLNCTPTTVRDFLYRDDCADLNLSSLRAVSAGGSACTEEILAAFRERFGFEVTADYGITESPCSMAQGDPFNRSPDGYVGAAQPHMLLSVRDAGGNPVPLGEVGELCAEPCAEGAWAGVWTGMLGILDNPVATRDSFHGLAMRTGDMARMDTEGRIAIVGRQKEMILRGGANVYPVEVERVLNLHDDVREAVVMGERDERLGQVVAAYLMLAPGAERTGLKDRLADYCRGQMAKYKVPERWYVVDAIPRNALNKPLKAQIASTPYPTLD
jgi:long-chain acyl-CoA synthetase